MPGTHQCRPAAEYAPATLHMGSCCADTQDATRSALDTASVVPRQRCVTQVAPARQVLRHRLDPGGQQR
eukprot:CAMPEP_0202875046 /NCGR_PEP_ID=MMETSP1391-20130828/26499_1 /ASSEMBLY_ACC=CAM_ASM_000867 /TAXON_ID=1034604 /ORGANISM="Chlamydomonas leiostraca, Strain SAG 11-49" /LENGTH=68 /DNA_ID=CAMNT_0049556633 /DNA_START=86 /DNA_END=288 /DNA_ORIENTATION=-